MCDPPASPTRLCPACYPGRPETRKWDQIGSGFCAWEEESHTLDRAPISPSGTDMCSTPSHSSKPLP